MKKFMYVVALVAALYIGNAIKADLWSGTGKAVKTSTVYIKDGYVKAYNSFNKTENKTEEKTSGQK